MFLLGSKKVEILLSETTTDFWNRFYQVKKMKAKLVRYINEVAVELPGF